MKEAMMQKPEMKSLLQIASLDKPIPQASKMVKVGSMLTSHDLEVIKDYNLGSVAIKVGNEAFFLNKNHSVPSNAVIARDQQGQILGIPAVAGG